VRGLREFAYLVWNELEKIYRKKRIAVIILILLILIPIFVYAQFKQVQTIVERLGTDDWKVALQQQIVDSQNRLNSSRIPEEWRAWLKVHVEQQQYYLDHNINPNAPGAPTFVKGFIENGISLFIPLLVMIVSIDIVSGERSDGTIKLLLTRPIRRWKILLSKYVAMVLAVSLIILMIGIISYLIAGLVFGYGGWNLPTLTGFVIENDTLNTQYVHLVPQWQYILMAYGLGWFVAVVVGTISFMVSVLIRNTPAGMGVMLAAIIAGNILSNFATAWEEAKYIFSVNLQLTDYLAGSLPVIKGLSMGFSLVNLSVWALLSLIVSFLVFTRQDMLS
jgi:ABC-2 type transport system permease protein